MRNLANEQKEELQRKIQDEQVKQIKKRWSTKAYIRSLFFLACGVGWWYPRGEAGLFWVFWVVGAVVAILIALWVYRDARKRSMRAVVWALFTFVFSVFALVLYLLETQEEPPVPGVEVNN